MAEGNNDILVREMTEQDYEQVREIYENGIKSGHATFERKAPEWEEFYSHKLPETLFVAVEAANPDKVVGWVSGAPISTRQVFHGVVEDSIYTDPEEIGRGIAGKLLDRFIERCAALGKWGIHSWIFPENEGSQRLHESRGFTKVATYHHIAKMPYGEREGEWRDTDVWEKLLDKPDIRVEDLPDT